MLDKAVTDAEALINAIGEVAYDDACKAKIDEARAAYDALTDAQKALVSNADALTTAETTYTELKAAADLAQAKTDAKAELAAYKNADDYRDAQKTELANAIAAGNEAIDAAADTAAVAAALASAKAVMGAIKTDAQLTAEELAAAKTAAKAQLAAYKNADDYRDAQKTELANAIAAGNEAIDAAADTAAVAAALASAKAVMGAIKTDAQLTAEELAAAKTAAKAQLAAYKNADDYRETQQTELTNAIDDGIAAINAATNTDEVAAALEAAKAVMDAIKTDAQLTAEELAEKAQDWQSVTIDDQIYINFMLDATAHANMQSITITYTNQDKETKPLDVDVTKLEKDGDFYKVPAVVAPAQIGDKVTVTITTTDGSDPTTYETSIADYCKHLIANYDGENAAAVKALAAATLEYGQAANDYFFGTHYYHESDITTITNAVDATKAAEAKGLTNHMSVNANGKIQSISYMALTKPEFRFYVNPESGLTEADYVALNDKITVNCDNANVLEKVSVQFVKNGDAILLEVTGIEAANMDEIITITIDGFGTITFCGNDFANLLAKNASTQTLGTALYLYGLAAKACF